MNRTLWLACLVALATPSCGRSGFWDTPDDDSSPDIPPCILNSDCPESCIFGFCRERSMDGGPCDDADDCLGGASCEDELCSIATPAYIVAFAEAGTIATEGSIPSVDVVVELDRLAETTQSVSVAASGSAGTRDVALATMVVEFAVGQASAFLNIQILDDIDSEPNETLVLDLIPGARQALGVPATFTLTVEDDDDASLHIAGVMHPTFNGGAPVTYNYTDDGVPEESKDDRATGVAIDAAGRILVSGSGTYKYNVSGDENAMAALTLALLPDGTFDTAYQYGTTSTPGMTANSDSRWSHGNDLVLDASHRVVVVGYREWSGTDDPTVYVHNQTTGAPDTTFNITGVRNIASTGEVEGWAIALDPTDGNFFVASSTSLTDLRVSKISSTSGALMTVFATTGTRVVDVAGNEQPTDMVVDSFGRVYVCGGYDGGGGTRDARVLRILGDGTLDPSFGAAGAFAYDSGGNDEAYGIALDASEDLFVVGSATATTLDLFVLKVDKDTGVLDTSFATGGVFLFDSIVGFPGVATDIGRAVAVGQDGFIYVAGESALDATTIAMALWKLTPAGVLDPRFGGRGPSITPGVFLASGAAGGNEDRGLALSIDGLGSVIVVGESRSAAAPSYFDIAIWRVD